MILWLRCSWINISSTNIYQASSLISKMWKQKYYSSYFRAPRDPHRMLTTWKLLWKCNWQNIPSTATRVCTQWCFCQHSSILTFIRSDQTNLLVESHLPLLLVLCWFKNLLQSLLSGTVNNMLLQATIIRNYFVKTQTYVASFGPPDLSIIFWSGMYLEVSPL